MLDRITIYCDPNHKIKFIILIEELKENNVDYRDINLINITD